MWCVLRNAKTEDKDLLFKWANDPDERANAFNTEPIPYEDHCKWFEAKMADPDVFIYILIDEDDTPIGMVRVEDEAGDGMISYFVDSRFRGQGYGTKILELIVRKMERIDGIERLVGEVKFGNLASAKAFEACGFEKTECDGFWTFTAQSHQ